MNMIKEQTKQDQTTLTTICDVLKQTVCFERATEAAERHAHALEVLSGARLPVPQQPPPAFTTTNHLHHLSLLLPLTITTSSSLLLPLPLTIPTLTTHTIVCSLSYTNMCYHVHHFQCYFSVGWQLIALLKYVY